MGFLGNLISDIFDSEDGAPFGQRIRANDQAFRDLYARIYYDFGLVPLRNLTENQRVPMTVSIWGTKLTRFEIHGNILTPSNFLTRGWGNPFNSISREINLIHPGRVWAFDTTRLHEGVLVGTISYPGNEDFAKSEEYLKILRTVGSAPTGELYAVPEVRLEFDEIWNRYRIPDRIFIAMKTTYPLSDERLQRLIQLILHAYNRSDAPPVTADYSTNAVDGIVTISMRETRQSAPPQPQTSAPQPPTMPAQPNTAPRQQAQPPEHKQDPADGFPYDFYRGLGLIDERDQVWKPSSVGDWLMIPYHMTEPQAKEYLLTYQPKN